jgi:putative ABC transport system permease protein
LPESQREVTALWVRTGPTGANLANTINEGRDAQAVVPLAEIYDLFQTVVGPAQTLLLVLTVLIVIVAGVGILVSMYNSMNERRREIAIMRSLGARRTTVLAIVLLESLLLSVGGGLLGVIAGHGLLGLVSPWIDSVSGVSIGSLQFEAKELMIIPGLVLLSVAVGFLPALDAYRTDVAKALSSSP